MTDKRFNFVCDDDNCFFKDGSKVLYCYEVVDLLNALHEENERLLTIHNMKKGALWEAVKELTKENEEMKKKGLDVLRFYQEKLKNTTNHNDFQSVRDEIWIVKQVLLEMGVVND